MTQQPSTNYLQKQTQTNGSNLQGNREYMTLQKIALARGKTFIIIFNEISLHVLFE